MLAELDLGSFFEKYIAPRFDKTCHLTIEPEVKEEYSELMAKGGRPIIYGNHQSHADGWSLGLTVQRLRDLAQEVGVDFPGVVLPLARSMFTGHQGKAVQVLNDLSRPILEKRGLRTLPYTRNKDVEKYGLKKKHSEVLAIARVIRDGYGVGYLPEASVKGGRHRNFLGFVFGGEIYGVIDIDDKDGFLGFYDLIKRFGQVEGETFFLPVAMEGSYRFFGADVTVPTWELIRALFIDPPNPIQATVERPITRMRLIQELGEDCFLNGSLLSDFLMKQVIRKLPPQSRGIYRKVSV